MAEFAEFMHTYGIAVICAIFMVIMSIILYISIQQMKRMEERMKSMEDFIRDIVFGARDENRQRSTKQQRILSENMANFSESATNAILSLNDEENSKE